MISRRYLAGVTACLLSLVLLSCSDFLNGKPAQQKALEFNNQEGACLKEMTTSINKVFQAQATVTEIKQAFQCLDVTVMRFQTHVEGRTSADTFTAEDIFVIFNKFHKEAGISKQIAEKILLLKQALFGGSKNNITKNEMNSLRSYLNVLRDETYKLLPYLKLYMFQKENGPFTRLMIQSGFVQLRSSLKTLLSKSEIVQSDYQFEDLKNLIIDLNLVKGEKKDLLSLAEKVKDFFIGKDNLKNVFDYESAIDQLTELMSLSSLVVHEDVVFEIANEVQMDKTMDFVEKTIQLFLNSIQMQKNDRLVISSLDSLVEEIINKKILPLNVQAVTFKGFYKKVIIRLFGEKKNISVDSLNFIEKMHLQSIKKEIAVFKLYLGFINSNQFKFSLERQTIASVQQRLKSYDVSRAVKNFIELTEEERKFIASGFEDLRSEFLSERPVIYRWKKMVIAENQSIWDVSWEDLLRALYGNMLARELVRGWGNSNVVKESQLIEWYTDFKPFAVEIKTFDKRSDSLKTGQETFLQANLFTSAGNGDNEISKTEAYQYVNMLFSGGNQTLTEMRDGLKLAGCNITEIDAFDFPMNDEACFYQDLKKNYKFYFSNLSYMVDYLGQLSNEDFKFFYESLMVVARRDAKLVGRIETADLRSLSMTMMYIESLYAVYDQNNNRNFSPAEIRFAYPRFTNFVTNYANKNAKQDLDEWDTILNPCRPLFPREAFIREAFIFMGYNGRLPKKADVNSPLINTFECLKANSSYQPFTFIDEIDRKTIINTFKVLKTALDSK